MNNKMRGHTPRRPLEYAFLSYPKRLLIPFIILLAAHTAHAQESEDHSTRKLYLDFGGAVGVFIPSDDNKDKQSNFGSNAVTYLQLNYHQNYFAKLQFGQTAVDYKAQQIFNGITSQINAKANSTNLGLSAGYQRSYGHWQPFILAGAGASFVDYPATSYNISNNTLNYHNVSGTYLYINAGLGVNYKISKSFTAFLEGQGSTLPHVPQSSNTHLSGFSALLGIKAPL